MKKLDKALLYEKVIGNIEKDLSERKIGGAAVVVAQNGEIALEKYLGYSDVEKKLPLREDSIFRLASMTKPITAVATLIAEERGYFSLEDPIADHFPEAANMLVGRLEGDKVVPDHKPRKTARLRDLLTHTSGIMCSTPMFLPQYYGIPEEAFVNNGKMVDYVLKNTCLTLDPCEATGYGAYNPFDMLAVLIQRKSGKSFCDFITENILSPLGLSDITFHPSERQWERMVAMCERTDEGELVNVEMGRHTFENFPLTYTCAGAGLVGTARDYLVFAEMLRRGGAYEGTRIITEDSARRLRTSSVPPSVIGKNATTNWGLSVRVIMDGYPFLVPDTYGWSGAYGTHFFIDPRNEITAIYMKNTRWYDSHGAGNTGRQFEAAVTGSLL